jgi:hypothetical protein
MSGSGPVTAASSEVYWPMWQWIKNLEEQRCLISQIRYGFAYQQILNNRVVHREARGVGDLRKVRISPQLRRTPPLRSDLKQTINRKPARGLRNSAIVATDDKISWTYRRMGAKITSTEHHKYSRTLEEYRGVVLRVEP